MTFYGLADYRLNDFGEVVEFRREQRAEDNLATEQALREREAVLDKVHPHKTNAFEAWLEGR